MTDGIAQKTCTPCRGGVAPLTQPEADGYLSQTPVGSFWRRRIC